MLNSRAGKLVFADGSVYHGDLLGAENAVGEVVFTTGMSGYQEVLTDPSYCGQIIVMTYPMIGNYGVSDFFNQSRKSFARGYVVEQLCEQPNNWRMQETIASFLNKQVLTCLYNVDTRAITRKIRNHGVLKGVIVGEEVSQAEIERLLATPEEHGQVVEVTTPEKYSLGLENTGKHVAVLDLGIKQNILQVLLDFNCKLTVFPATATFEEILASSPDGIFLSNGPGDPKDLPFVIAMVKKLIGQKPIFGICLGHQMLALALGADTYKLKFGHRGINHPVIDLELDKVFISSQNHGYAVTEESLVGLPLQITHLSVNDRTIEGFKHTQLPIFSVQYHPEAAPGPDGHEYLFERFLKNMGEK